MKILQVTAPGSAFQLLDVAIPEPAPGEALVRIAAVTTCPQWDLHLRHDEPMFVGHRFLYPYAPGQPGHEATGVVEAVGEEVTEVAVGDRVSVWRDPGHHKVGCYAQYAARPVADLIRVPAHLPPQATAPVELAMCVGATFLMLRSMGVLSGRRVAISGLGPAGLVAAQMARAEGAASVLGLDLTPARREYALAQGWVDAAHDPRQSDLPLRHAAAIDTAVDCVGAKTSVEWLMDRTGDVVALFGVQREAFTFDVRHYTLRLCGYPGHSRLAADYAVGLIAAGTLDLSPLATHHLPLSRYADGIALLERQEAIKVCFDPWA